MAVGIVGAGRLGKILARLISRSGRIVEVCNSCGPMSLADLGLAFGVTDVLVDQDIVLLAIPFCNHPQLARNLFANKIIIDSMNYDLASDGPIPPLDSGLVTSSELVAMHFSASSVIKAFNTLPAALLAGMATPERLIPDRQAIFIAGDDLRAKSIVAGLAEDCGYAPVDTGSLKEGGQLQIPGGPLFGRAMTGRMAEKHKSDGWLTL